MYSYACRHWAKPADPHVVNAGGYTPLTLASKLGRKEIFEEMLELMKVEFWRFSDMTCSAYPLTTLDTIRPDGSTSYHRSEKVQYLSISLLDYDSALMTVINGSTSEHLDMIGSEVIQRLLADKWKAFASVRMDYHQRWTPGGGGVLGLPIFQSAKVGDFFYSMKKCGNS
jgi:transient receptor potential cation channel subfamily V protein 6